MIYLLNNHPLIIYFISIMMYCDLYSKIILHNNNIIIKNKRN